MTHLTCNGKSDDKQIVPGDYALFFDDGSRTFTVEIKEVNYFVHLSGIYPGCVLKTCVERTWSGTYSAYTNFNFLDEDGEKDGSSGYGKIPEEALLNIIDNFLEKAKDYNRPLGPEDIVYDIYDPDEDEQLNPPIV